MTRASLLNPFNLYQEPGHSSNQKPARIVNLRTTRSTPVCISHATVQWSNESQEWELANTFGEPAHCIRCNGPCGIVWLPLN
jgi:hypothetical protein